MFGVLGRFTFLGLMWACSTCPNLLQPEVDRRASRRGAATAAKATPGHQEEQNGLQAGLKLLFKVQSSSWSTGSLKADHFQLSKVQCIATLAFCQAGSTPFRMLLGDLREATDAFAQAAALNAEDGDSLYYSAITHFDNTGMRRKPWQDSQGSDSSCRSGKAGYACSGGGGVFPPQPCPQR